MSRPRMKRRISSTPEVSFYKPRGVPLKSLEIVEISLEEYEALRLKYDENLEQTKCAQKMNTSQSTFQRILSKALSKTSKAIVQGKAISIIKE